MTRYAAKTEVSTERTRMEIERTLQRYGATSFAYGMEANQAMVIFQIDGRRIKFILTLPDPKDCKFTHHSRGMRTPEAARSEWEQSCRQIWRALSLVIKAKLEAVAAGITTIEDEFLAHTLLPDGSTFGRWAKPQIDRAYQLGHMPSVLGLGYDKGDIVDVEDVDA